LTTELWAQQFIDRVPAAHALQRIA
jgi:hypothetical protein